MFDLLRRLGAVKLGDRLYGIIHSDELSRSTGHILLVVECFLQANKVFTGVVGNNIQIVLIHFDVFRLLCLFVVQLYGIELAGVVKRRGERDFFAEVIGTIAYMTLADIEGLSEYILMHFRCEIFRLQELCLQLGEGIILLYHFAALDLIESKLFS